MAQSVEEPDNLICPITFVMFQDPVVVQCGNTYERSAIESYWQYVGCLRDPLSNQILETDMLFPNLDKRRDVLDFLQRHGTYTPRGWTSPTPPSPKNRPIPQKETSEHPDELHQHPDQRMPAHRPFWLPPDSLQTLLCMLSCTLCGVVALMLLRKAAHGEPLQWMPGGLFSHLADIGFRTSSHLKTLSMGGILGCIDGMRTHLNVLEVQLQCSEVLASLSSKSANQGKIAASGGIEVLLQAMRVHTFSRELQKACLIALRNVAFNADSQVSIAQLGGIELVLASMRLFAGDQSMFEQSAYTLGNLALNTENDVQIVAQNGVDLLVQGMKRYPKSKEVQQESCRCLGNLAINSGNHEPVGQSIEVLIDAMSSFPSEENVQRQCAWALGNLASDSANQAAIATLGGIDRTLGAMRMRNADAEMLRECSRVIGNLAMSFDAIRMQVGLRGGVDVLLQVMQDNLQNSVLQRHIAQALKGLASNPHMLRRIVLGGGVELLARMKRIHAGHPHLQTDAIEVLRKVATDQEGRDRIAAVDHYFPAPSSRSLLAAVDEEL